MKTKRIIALVYQAGIANVFAVPCLYPDKPSAQRVRLMQSDFNSCECFARGMGAAGEKVRSYACNMAGDIALQTWGTDLDSAPFRESFRAVKCN